MSDLVGKHFGRYRLLKLLGSGGFAEVYLGEHTKLGTQAAVKILHTHLSETEAEHFQREARIIAQLDHPNIVRILDFDEQRGVPFLVMPFYVGGTLATFHKPGEQVSLLNIITYVGQMSEALSYAHERKLIHRDVKPANMLIGSRGEILLADFGIAAVAHSTSSMSSSPFGGTLAYMAPEQIQAKARPASDQYALAITVFEWLCGTLPFKGTLTEVISKHLQAPPPPLHAYRPDLPQDVEQVLMTALAKVPQQRFDTVRAFAHALELAAQKRADDERPPGQMQPLAPTILPERASIPPTIAADLGIPSTLAASGERARDENVSLPLLLPEDDKRRRSAPVSRRRLLFGLGTAGVLAATGFAAWSFVSSRRPSILYQGHNGQRVFAVAWSPDDKRLATGGGSTDGTVQIWDASGGGLLSTYKGHQFYDTGFFSEQVEEASVMALSWSPDGKEMASGSVCLTSCRSADLGNSYREAAPQNCQSDERFLGLSRLVPQWHLPGNQSYSQRWWFGRGAHLGGWYGST